MLERIPLSYYAFAGLLNFITSFALLIFVFFKNPKSRTNQTFSLFAFTVAGWSLCYFLWMTTDKSYQAEVYLRTLMLFVIFIPSTFTHFVLTFLKTAYDKKIIYVNYLISFLLGLTVYTQLFAKDIGPFLVFPYWLKPGPLFYVHAIHFFANVIYAHFLMLRSLKHHVGVFRNQIFYILIGTAIGYSSGAINYLTWCRVPIPPFLNPLVSVYVAFVSYAIIKYRLMNISIVFTRATIFAMVYLVVLGIPFEIGIAARPFLSARLGVNWWILPSLLLALLSTIGPFVYLYLQRRAENIILKKQRRYQETLRKAAKGMILIKDSDKLQKLIVHILTKTIPIAYAGIYLYDEKNKNFVLKANRGDRFCDVIEKINEDSSIVKYLFKMKKPVFIENIKNTNNIKGLERNIINETINIAKNMNSTLIIPSFVENEMLGFLALGGKKSGHSYTDDDLSVLSILTNQAALAIENAQFYEKSSKEIADISERKGVDKTSVGAAHQMKNTLARVSTDANLVLTAINVSESKGELTPEKSNSLLALAKNNMQEIVKEAERGRVTLDTILYPAKVRENFADLNMCLLVKQALEASSRTKSKDILERNIPAPILSNNVPESFPHIIGNEKLIEQTLENLINNAFDAILWRYSYLKPESSYIGRITVTAKDKGEAIAINVEDNGIGMKDEVKEKLFAGYFTTKSVEHKGDGAGLYTLRDWVEKHKGRAK